MASRIAVKQFSRPARKVKPCLEIAVDKDAGAYIPRIFGAGAYAIVSKPGRLTNALPYLYRQMVRS